MNTLQLIVSTMFVCFLLSALSGCQEQTPSENNMISVDLPALILTVDDLPEGYSQNYESNSYGGGTGFEDTPIESYRVSFVTGNLSDIKESNIVRCALYKFPSPDNASKNFALSLEYFNYPGKIEVVNDSINTIGDESKGFIVQLPIENVTDNYILFRVANVICFINAGHDYSLVLDLSHIVEKRLYDALS